MGASRVRTVLIAALTVAALGLIGPAPAQGSEAPPAAAETRATTLEAGQPNLFRIHLSLAPRAKLTDSVTGAPLAGQLVRFFRIPTHNLPLPNPTACYAYTDAAGVAKCGGLGVVRDFLFSGARYRAAFPGATVGDVTYAPSEDIVRLYGRQ
jgi:hypothetical protein